MNVFDRAVITDENSDANLVQHTVIQSRQNLILLTSVIFLVINHKFLKPTVTDVFSAVIGKAISPDRYLTTQILC